MFTGIVKGLRTVHSVIDIEGGRKLLIQLEDLAEGLEVGASVSVNGTCLTTVKVQDGVASFDVIQESLNRTNLGRLKQGERVNIERASRYGEEVGGHQVTGHIDHQGVIDEVIHSPNNVEMFIRIDAAYQKYLIPKGWIAIDGISLTVVQVLEGRFSVCLIPETLEITTLGFKQKGDEVNLEYDHTTKVIVETMERLLPEMLKTRSL